MVAHHIVAPPHPENVITTPVSHGVHSYPRTPRCGATSMGFSVMNILPLRLPLWSYRTDALRLQQQCNFVSAPSCARMWVQHHACPQPFQCDAAMQEVDPIQSEPEPAILSHAQRTKSFLSGQMQETWKRQLTNFWMGWMARSAVASRKCTASWQHSPFLQQRKAFQHAKETFSWPQSQGMSIYIHIGRIYCYIPAYTLIYMVSNTGHCGCCSAVPLLH